MNNHTFYNDYSLDNLMERAKELNCLYQVDEILGIKGYRFQRFFIS